MTLLSTQITEAIAARLRGCVVGAGYRSDVGASVHVGRRQVTATQAPCVCVVPGRGSGALVYGDSATQYTRQIEVRAFADLNAHPELARPSDPEAADCDLADMIIWDVRRCLEVGAPLPGVDYLHFISDAPGYREDGGTLVGALLLYEVRFAVSLLDPSQSI